MTVGVTAAPTEIVFRTILSADGFELSNEFFGQFLNVDTALD